MKALIGLNLKKAKEVAKHELGVKRMGEARFKMILDEGIKRGDFIINGDMIESTGDLDFFGIEEIEEPTVEEPTVEEPNVSDQTSYEIKTKITHPEEANIDPRLSRSDLPRSGDMYFYRSYTGDVVQGEVKSAICFVECLNPNGTWQTVSIQDLYLKKKGVPKETTISNLTAYYQTNNHLNTERKKLLNEIAELEAKVAELKKDLAKSDKA